MSKVELDPADERLVVLGTTPSWSGSFTLSGSGTAADGVDLHRLMVIHGIVAGKG